MNLQAGKKVLTCLLVSNMIFMQTGNITQAASIRKADVTKASQGNELIGVSGKYENVSKS